MSEVVAVSRLRSARWLETNRIVMRVRTVFLPISLLNAFHSSKKRLLVMCFFFQVEDGIRDYKVTGVQTCALPICGDDERALALVRAVNHDETAAALTAERTFLAVLEGSCRTPIAGYAAVAAGRLAFRGLIADRKSVG